MNIKDNFSIYSPKRLQENGFSFMAEERIWKQFLLIWCEMTKNVVNLQLENKLLTKNVLFS